MPRISTGPKTRLNLEMSGAVRERLENLRKRIDADSLAEVVRRALAVYDFVSATRAAGGQVLVRDAHGKEREVLLFD